MTDIQKFILNYNSNDESKIRFAWNGKHGSQFGDDNYGFRKEVLEEVLNNHDSVDLLLIRDLFRAETELSKEAWSIDRRVSRLAEILLKRGGSAYVEEYLIGRGQSFDAYLACGDVNLNAELIQMLLNAVEERLEQERELSKRSTLEFGREIFKRWAKSGDVSGG